MTSKELQEIKERAEMASADVLSLIEEVQKLRVLVSPKCTCERCCWIRSGNDPKLFEPSECDE